MGDLWPVTPDADALLPEGDKQDVVSVSWVSIPCHKRFSSAHTVSYAALLPSHLPLFIVSFITAVCMKGTQGATQVDFVMSYTANITTWRHHYLTGPQKGCNKVALKYHGQSMADFLYLWY